MKYALAPALNADTTSERRYAPATTVARADLYFCLNDRICSDVSSPAPITSSKFSRLGASTNASSYLAAEHMIRKRDDRRIRASPSRNRMFGSARMVKYVLRILSPAACTATNKP